MPSRPTLADLVAPLGAEDFIARHWLTGTPHLSRANPRLAELLRMMPALADVHGFLEKFHGEVAIMGKDGFRAPVAANVAARFLDNGYNLYAAHAETAVPEARALLSDVVAELGVSCAQVSLEVFAGRKGGVSRRHYDHDANFQILLAGEKEWELEPNQNIENPLIAYAPPPHAPGLGFPEEAHASSKRIPITFDAERSKVVKAVAGSVLYLPRGLWHETRALTDTWSVNLVVRGFTWSEAVTRAILDRLHRDPALRAYATGHGYGEHESPSLHAAAEVQFERARAAAAAALAAITLDEALLSQNGATYAWTDASDAREVMESAGTWTLRAPGALAEELELDADLAPIVRALASLRGPFTWSHALAIAGAQGATALHNLIGDLIEMGLIAPIRG